MLMEKASKIKLLFLDVDGVMTDGVITMTDQGEETKAFNVKDGLGLKMLKSSGVEIVIVTGRRSKVAVRRARELGIEGVYQSVKDKKALCKQLKEAKGLKFGLTGPTGTPAMVCRQILELVLNMQDVKPILGIESSPGITLAVVRGEYDGSALPVRTILKYVQKGSVRPLALLTRERCKDVPNVPTVYEALEGVKLSEEAKFWIDRVVAVNEVYRTVVATPGTPKDRVEFLRECFAKCFQEKELLKRGVKGRMRLKFISGADVTKEIAGYMEMSPERKARFKERLKF